MTFISSNLNFTINWLKGFTVCNPMGYIEPFLVCELFFILFFLLTVRLIKNSIFNRFVVNCSFLLTQAVYLIFSYCFFVEPCIVWAFICALYVGFYYFLCSIGWCYKLGIGQKLINRLKNVDSYVVAWSTLIMFTQFFQLKIVAACNFDNYTIFSFGCVECVLQYALGISIASLCYLKSNSILKALRWLRWCFFDIKLKNIGPLIGSYSVAILVVLVSINTNTTIANCASSLDLDGKVIAITEGHVGPLNSEVPKFDAFCNVDLLRLKGIALDQLGVAYTKKASGINQIFFQNNLVPAPDFIRLKDYPEIAVPFLTEVFLGRETNIQFNEIVFGQNTDEAFEDLRQRGFTRMPSKRYYVADNYCHFDRPFANASASTTTSLSLSNGRASPWVVDSREKWVEPLYCGFIDNRRPLINVLIQVDDMGPDYKPIVRDLSAEIVF